MFKLQISTTDQNVTVGKLLNLYESCFLILNRKVKSLGRLDQTLNVKFLHIVGLEEMADVFVLWKRSRFKGTCHYTSSGELSSQSTNLTSSVK